MEKVVLFGASKLGEESYTILSGRYEIVYYCDNDSNKWGKFLNGTKVISPKELTLLDDYIVIITSSYHLEISIQLQNLGLRNILYFNIGNQGVPLLNGRYCQIVNNGKNGILSSTPVHEVFMKVNKTYGILGNDYGYLNSVKQLQCVDRDGEPIPWYTYPAIEYIKQLDFSGKSVFEYGSGNSSLFWGKIARNVVSVEGNKQWYEQIHPLLDKHNKTFLIENKAEYVSLPDKMNAKFDVIIIDGEYRDDCVDPAIRYLNPGGMIILDNSDWYTDAAQRLRDADMIQIDMSGFGPINAYTWTTSFFLRRDFSFKPKYAVQPIASIAGIKN